MGSPPLGPPPSCADDDDQAEENSKLRIKVATLEATVAELEAKLAQKKKRNAGRSAEKQKKQRLAAHSNMTPQPKMTSRMSRTSQAATPDTR